MAWPPARCPDHVQFVHHLGRDREAWPRRHHAGRPARPPGTDRGEFRHVPAQGWAGAAGRADAVEGCRHGSYDEHWERAMRYLRQRRDRDDYIFRPGWEWNSAKSYPWGIVDVEWAEAYQATFRRLVGIIKTTFPNAKIDWCSLKKGQSKKRIDLFSPATTSSITSVRIGTTAFPRPPRRKPLRRRKTKPTPMAARSASAPGCVTRNRRASPCRSPMGCLERERPQGRRRWRQSGLHRADVRVLLRQRQIDRLRVLFQQYGW